MKSSSRIREECTTWQVREMLRPITTTTLFLVQSAPDHVVD